MRGGWRQVAGEGRGGGGSNTRRISVYEIDGERTTGREPEPLGSTLQRGQLQSVIARAEAIKPLPIIGRARQQRARVVLPAIRQDEPG